MVIRPTPPPSWGYLPNDTAEQDSTKGAFSQSFFQRRRAAGRGVRGEISKYRGVVRVPRRVFRSLLPERLTPPSGGPKPTIYNGPGSRASLSGSCARRQLTADGNALITGRDLREGSPAAPVRIETWQ
jgi:hypothetical protein